MFARPQSLDCDIGSVEANFTLISPAEQLQLVVAHLNAYVSLGILSNGNGNALITKINSAINKIINNKFTPAINKLQAFTNQVNAFIQTEKLTQVQGQALIDFADYVIEQLNGDGNTLQTEIPKDYNLSQNYPNPFNPVTNINFALPFDGKVTITIYDITGREVKTLVNDFQPAGYHTLQFDASSFASGVYFYRILAGDFSAIKKMLLIK